jgi:hypothetical protein
MAITILDEPNNFTPVYNQQPLYIKVESDKTNEEGFTFRFDLYVNDAFVNTVNLLPRPGTNYTLYSPARILESYVSYDLNSSLFGVTVPELDSASTNCVVNWSVNLSEEYIFYWPFFDTQFNTTDTLTRLVNSGDTKHQFIIGDKIIVDTPLYPYFSGIHTVVDVIDEYTVVINKLFIVTPLNPGTATWTDKRKSEFQNSQIVLNNTMIPTEGGYTTYGPDAGNNELSFPSVFFNEFMFILFDDSIISGNTIESTVTTTETIISNKYYKVSFEIGSVANPSNCDAYIQIYMGGTLGAIHYLGASTGTPFTIEENILCGTSDTDVKIIFSFAGADTSGGQTHQVTLNGFNILNNPIGYSFNSVFQYEQTATYLGSNNWDYLIQEYEMIPGSFYIGKFLTKQPRKIKTKLADLGSIGWLNSLIHSLTPDRVYFIRITTNNGVSINTNDVEITSMYVEATDNKIIEFGIYPQNINSYSQNSPIPVNWIDEFVTDYTVQLMYAPTLGDPLIGISEIFYFEMDNTCSKYLPVRFMFLNSFGQFEYYNATLLSRTTINGTRDTFVKTLGYNYEIGDRGKTVINVNSQESYVINTDWVSEETANWLSYEFFNSPEMYILTSDNNFPIPIVLDTTSIEVKKRVNDKLFNYTFNYSKAVPLNTQRN